MILNKTSNKIKKWITLPKEKKSCSGGRKRATARVYVFLNTKEKSELVVNGKKGNEYFSEFMLNKINTTLNIAENKYSAACRVSGGGIKGQAEAISHAIAKAIVQFDENLKKSFRSEGKLTRDARIVEPKKTGLHKARKSKQWSKR